MSASPDWDRVRDLFHRALDVPADERAVFVRREAGADTAIRDQVESLLAAHDRADGFLSQGAMDGNRKRGSSPGSRTRTSARSTTSARRRSMAPGQSSW